MATDRRLSPATIAETIQQRCPDQVLALRDHLIAHPGPPTPPAVPAMLSHRAISHHDLRVTIGASTLRLDYLPEITEWRISITAHDRARRRLPVPTTEAHGWVHAILGEPAIGLAYRHHTEPAYGLPITHYVLYHDHTGPIPPPAGITITHQLRALHPRR